MDLRGLDYIGVASVGPRASSDDSFGAALGDTGGVGRASSDDSGRCAQAAVTLQRPLRKGCRGRYYASAPITLSRPLHGSDTEAAVTQCCGGYTMLRPLHKAAAVTPSGRFAAAAVTLQRPLLQAAAAAERRQRPKGLQAKG